MTMEVHEEIKKRLDIAQDRLADCVDPDQSYSDFEWAYSRFYYQIIAIQDLLNRHYVP